jgi:Protein kinase domain/GAF domain
VLQAPIPADEERRLALLAACHIMYTPAEQAFDDVAQLAADLCDAEIALITLVDSDYQWFKARVGVEQTGTPRDLSFCGHCIVGRQPFVVEDTHLDTRFADNPLVTGDPYLRFYTGVPLVVDGLAVGALSVADRRPRSLTERQLDALQRLAAQIARELRLRRDLARASSQGDTVVISASSNAPPIAAGTVIGGRWQVSCELGRGGAGVVFEAHDRDGLRVAIKAMLPRWARYDALLERFAREARVLLRLTSPNVAKLYDVGNLDAEQGGLPYLVLEFLEGEDLGDVIEERKRVPYDQAFRWCADACEGVAAAHDLGIVHRDLKPSNVFLTATGAAASIVKVLDFGIAAGDPIATPVRLTANDDVIGSPAYMSPEQQLARPDIDGRSDVWSMGASLYELITGHLPFPGDSPLAMFANAQTRPPVPLAAFVAVPPAVQEIVATCLRKERADRYASMRALGQALRAAAT